MIKSRVLAISQNPKICFYSIHLDIRVYQMDGRKKKPHPVTKQRLCGEKRTYPEGFDDPEGWTRSRRILTIPKDFDDPEGWIRSRRMDDVGVVVVVTLVSGCWTMWR
jgi:hypothetical protein